MQNQVTRKTHAETTKKYQKVSSKCPLSAFAEVIDMYRKLCLEQRKEELSALFNSYDRDKDGRDKARQGKAGRPIFLEIGNQDLENLMVLEWCLESS